MEDKHHHRLWHRQRRRHVGPLRRLLAHQEWRRRLPVHKECRVDRVQIPELSQHVCKRWRISVKGNAEIGSETNKIGRQAAKLGPRHTGEKSRNVGLQSRSTRREEPSCELMRIGWLA
jgi:hypothetical protein